MQTKHNEYTRKIEKHEINELPLVHYQGSINLVQRKNEVEQVVRQIEQCSILGFDTETRPAFKKGQKFMPSLLQLADDKSAYIFQLKKTGLPACLRKILASPNIVKVGVAVHDDIKALQYFGYFMSAGFSDLSKISKKNKLQNHGLRTLCASLLKFRISKKAQRSNWSKTDLTQSQITYAATDAWVSREVYLKMQALGLEMN